MIPGNYYFIVYFNALLLLVLFECIRINGHTQKQLLTYTTNFPLAAFILAIAFCVYWGLRPVASYPLYFADSWGYYNSYATGGLYVFRGSYSIFTLYSRLCKIIGLSASQWLFLTNILQIFPIFYACKRLFNDKAYFPMLFFCATFGFISFAFNILKAGLAVAFTILGLSFFKKGKRNLWIMALCFFIAWGFHRSITITLGSLAISFFLKRNVKVSLSIWFVCLLLSIVLGRYFDSYFMDFFDDDKFTTYITAKNTGKGFSRVGFRWDFVLYSLWPIIVGWYFAYKDKYKDKYYTLIFNTYVIANAFWVLINQVKFSDRFAGLSWFLIPLIFSYPILKMKIGERQGSIGALLLFAMFCFNYFISVLR